MDSRAIDRPELGERYRLALVKAARLRGEALTAERLQKRVYSRCYLAAEGTVAMREHTARTQGQFIAAEDAWLEKQSAADLAEAEAEAMRARMEVWRTQESSRRAEMQMR